MAGSTQSAELRVVTFNVRYGSAKDGDNDWTHRKEIFFDCIRGMRPDILDLQECLSFQADEIKERFPSMDHFGLGRFDGTQTNRNHELYSGEHCTIFYDLDKLALEKTGTFWLSDTPDVPGSHTWGNNLPRIVTWGILRRRDDGGRLAVFNTHFDSGDTFDRGAAALVTSRIAQIAEGMPVLLTGDFNIPAGSAYYLPFTETLTDVWTALKMPEKEAGTSHSFSGKPEKRIDWILFSPGFDAVSVEKVTYNRDGRYPSDHFPLLAVLRPT